MDKVPVDATGSTGKIKLTGSADASPANMMKPRNYNVGKKETNHARYV
ncbi:hypothetical protein OAT72_06015 [Alphaproteobacteria bacterium]|nr:hypothetical protein [Alphaproteobacteria bacterium]